MKFPVSIINILDYLPWHLDAPTDDARVSPRENANSTVSLDDPQRQHAAIQQKHYKRCDDKTVEHVLAYNIFYIH
jgi:hypothetical protein